MKIKFDEFLFESAPRLPKSEEYWKKKGKSGKDVCLIFHDDMDGIVSAIIMKNYLINQGFKIKQYGVINYQEGWEAFRINSNLIIIALDFADDIPGVDVYVDHHGSFEEDVRLTQKKASVKTATGSAAEGIAQQLGVPFSKDVKEWIDMIDSAKYDEYNVDIRNILNLDIKSYAKSKEGKLELAAAVNQMMKRGDDKTLMEIVNSCQEPSIYNIFRLFKLFYPKNNPDFMSGNETEFVSSGRDRLKTMQSKTRGKLDKGYHADETKIVYNSMKKFWADFAVEVKDQPGKWQLMPGGYQIIGNLMYVPSGTWANALRAKAIFNQDLDNGIVPDDPKLNFVLLQYGNTLQVADIRTKIKNMDKDDLPKYKNGKPIDNLGKYCEGLLKNFVEHLDYQDERTVSGGHDGIGTISNIFGKCLKEGYEDSSFLDMFKNKMISDISGVNFPVNTPWNEKDGEVASVKPEDINKKLRDIDDIRSEDDTIVEKDERAFLNYIIYNGLEDEDYTSKFKNDTMRKIYEIWRDSDGFTEITYGDISKDDIKKMRFFKKTTKIEKSELFSQIINKFGFDVYQPPEETNAKPRITASDKMKKQRYELRRILNIIFNMDEKTYIDGRTDSKFKEWAK